MDAEPKKKGRGVGGLLWKIAKDLSNLGVYEI